MKTKMNNPDPFKHLIISMIKSLTRMIGFGALAFNIYIGCSILIVAETIGVLEELV